MNPHSGRFALIAVCLAATLFAVTGSSATAADPAASAEALDPVVARLFGEYCLRCHGSDAPKGGLDLTHRATALKGGESGPALMPGSPEQSLLLERIKDKSMPPGKDDPRPAKEQIARLEQWIKDGARWPADRILSPFEATTDRRAGFDWWSLQPVVRPPVPAVANADRARNPIDAFVLQSLEQKKLSFAPEADRRTLARRLSLDLVGLPPAWDEVEAFEKDESPDAYERLVDRLLSSPRYGERWARPWLDVVRYTESDGFEQDKYRPHAWRYRDYVIRAFNDDKPYDVFVREQLAGDAVEPLTRDGILATGFLVAGPWDEIQNVGSSGPEKRRAHEEQVEELLGTISQTFLGLTVNCARCHDHKFDPIPQTDYYRLKAVFDGVDHSLGSRDGNRPFFTPGEMEEHDLRLAPTRTRLDELTKQIAALDAKLPDAATAVKTGGAIVAPGQFGTALDARQTLAATKSKDAFRTPPLTVECRVKCGSPGAFNVFVAQNDKSAGDHWEIYSFAGPGDFSAYLPGYSPDTIRSGVPVADDKWHFVAMRFDGKRVRLHVDGKLAGDVAVERKKEPAAAGELWIGGYAPQNIGCAGLIDEVRISNTLRDDTAVPAEALSVDDHTVGLWTFEESNGNKFANRAARATDADLPAILARRDELAARSKSVKAELDALTLPVAYLGYRREPPQTHVLARGDSESPGEPVAGRGLTAIRVPSADLTISPRTPEAERRARFARWLTAPRHPLTPRVIVNRLWQAHFGEGLVGTPSDFGFHAGKPSHPELLDWLADELVRSGWSLKHIHRLIVTSAAYRQSVQFDAAAATIDAGNRLLWRFAPRRLDGETVRDALLAVSGDLAGPIGGPSYEPWTVTVFNTHFYHLVDNGTPQQNRRTLYRASVITGRDPFLDALDCPSPAVNTPRRRTTITPLQALALMNEPLVQRSSERIAARLGLQVEAPVENQIRRAVERIFGRPASDAEVRSLTNLAKSHGLPQACWVLLNGSEFLYLR